MAVYINGQHAGYVPRDISSHIAPIMDSGVWTYACPTVWIKWWDEREIYTAMLSIERRRPNPDVIGFEHQPDHHRNQQPLPHFQPSARSSQRASDQKPSNLNNATRAKTEEVTHAELDALRSRLHDLNTEHDALRIRVRELSRRLASLRLAALYFSAVCASRKTAERFNVWPTGVLVLLPPFLGLVGLVVLDIVTGMRALSAIIAAVIVVGSLAVLLGLLVYPADSVAAAKCDSASTQIPNIFEQLVRCKERSNELSAIIRSESQRFHYLKRIQSREYKLQQLFNRNWRAMRGEELEDYLVEVFGALGCSAEKTKTTGDQGVDLVVCKDSTRIAVQVKGYVSSVSNSAVQEAFAGKAHYNCHACAVITNSRFTSSANELARSTGCVLIGEDEFRDFVFGRVDLAAAVAAGARQHFAPP